MPAAECNQIIDEDTFLDCVGKPSSPLATTATECIQANCCACGDHIGKTSSPLAMPVAECIHTERQTPRLKSDLSNVYHGNYMQSCSVNPCSNIRTGRSGDPAPRLGDSPDKPLAAIVPAAKTTTKKATGAHATNMRKGALWCRCLPLCGTSGSWFGDRRLLSLLGRVSRPAKAWTQPFWGSPLLCFSSLSSLSFI